MADFYDRLISLTCKSDTTFNAASVKITGNHSNELQRYKPRNHDLSWYPSKVRLFTPQPLCLVNHEVLSPYLVLMVLSKWHRWFYCSCIEGMQKAEGMELWNALAIISWKYCLKWSRGFILLNSEVLRYSKAFHSALWIIFLETIVLQRNILFWHYMALSCFPLCRSNFYRLLTFTLYLTLPEGLKIECQPLNGDFPERKALHTYDWVKGESILLLFSEWIIYSHT